MLKVFRDNLKYLSWVLWLVILVFILFVFVDFGATVPGGSGGVADAAAVVGREKISYGEFERAYRQAEDNLRGIYGQEFTSEMARQAGLPWQVMDGLIADRILIQEARRMGLAVTDGEVRRTILSYPVFLDDNGKFVGEEQYQRILRSNRLDSDSFEASVRADLLGRKVRNVLLSNVFVGAAEVETAYREAVETASIRFIKLPLQQVAEVPAPRPDEVAAWYESHREDFQVPERRTVEYLLVDRAEIEAGVELEESEIARYYRENQDEFTSEEQVRARHILLRVDDQRSAEEAQRQIAEIRGRIERGESFEELARELSDDPGSKEQGGDLGFFGRGQMVQPFEEAAFATEPGQLSEPVVSSFGVHLIEVLERRPGGVQPLEEVSALIRNRLRTERARVIAENRAQELAGRIERERVSGEDGLRALADEETGVTFLVTDPFAEDDNVPGIGRATAFTVAAFDLAEEETSEPVKVQRGWAILRLRAIEPPRVPELDEVRADVEEALREERRQEAALARLAEARKRLEGGEELDAIAESLGLEVEESGEFGSGGRVSSLGADARVIEAALGLDEGGIGGPLPLADGAVLFQVVARQRFDPVAFEESRAETRADLAERRANELLAALIDARREQLKVRYDPAFVENFERTDGP